MPSVEPIAIITDRTDPAGEPLESALVTRHLQFSLPYRALFSNTLRPDTVTRLLDALAALLVQLHLNGFFWGDVSLSNTLFRRDAGAFAAYLVDAETGALHPSVSNGQRLEDLEIARVNIFGEMLDLQAAGVLHASIDPEAVADDVVAPLSDPLARGHLRAGDHRRRRAPPDADPDPPPQRPRLRRRRSCSWPPRTASTGSGRRWSTPATTPAGCCG